MCEELNKRISPLINDKIPFLSSMLGDLIDLFDVKLIGCFMLEFMTKLELKSDSFSIRFEKNWFCGEFTFEYTLWLIPA